MITFNFKKYKTAFVIEDTQYGATFNVCYDAHTSMKYRKFIKTLKKVYDIEDEQLQNAYFEYLWQLFRVEATKYFTKVVIIDKCLNMS